METTSPATINTETPRRSSPKNRSQLKTSSVARHQRFCSICQHPRREDIDDDILRWRSPEDIAYEFKLGDRSTVYRHGRALNLFSQRKQNLNPALERLIESVYDAKPSAAVILKAMGVYARINGNDAFNDLPKQVVITHATARSEEVSSRMAAKLPTASPANAGNSNQQDSAKQGISYSVSDEDPVGAPLAAPNARPQPGSPTAGVQVGTATDEVVSGYHSAPDEPQVTAAEAEESASAAQTMPSSLHKLREKLAEVLDSRPDIAKVLTNISCVILVLTSLLLVSCSRFVLPASSIGAVCLPPATGHQPLNFYPPHEPTIAKTQIIENIPQSNFLPATKRLFSTSMDRPVDVPSIEKVISLTWRVASRNLKDFSGRQIHTVLPVYGSA